MITILRGRKWLMRWSKPLFRKHSLPFSTTSKGYLQTASILGNFEGRCPLVISSKIKYLRSIFNKGSHLGYGGKGKRESEHPIFEGSGNQSTLFLREVGVRVPSLTSRRGKWESESPMGNIRYSGRGTHFDCISSNLRARLFDFLTSVIKSISGYRTYLASRTLARFPRRISVS